MPAKFWSIVKANARIDELESELAAAKASPPNPPEAGKSDEKITALEKRLDEMAGSLAALGDQISHLEDAGSASLDKFSVEIARIDKALADATPEKVGSRIAAEITSRQGQPPLAAGATPASSNGSGDIEQQLQSISDPKQRANFYKAHEKELKARMKRNGNATK